MELILSFSVPVSIELPACCVFWLYVISYGGSSISACAGCLSSLSLHSCFPSQLGCGPVWSELFSSLIIHMAQFLFQGVVPLCKPEAFWGGGTPI